MTISPDFLRALAAAGAAETLPRFRNGSRVINKKEGGFDPVTEADREAEKAIRALIRKEFPSHGIVGEEFEPENGDADHVWIIDPIDGTRAFIAGLPLWGTLVGLTVKGKAVAGMMAQPFTGELFRADETGAHFEGPGGARPLSVSGATELEQAILCTTTPALFDERERAVYDRLEGRVRMARYGTDCYAYAMLAAGQVDLVVESGLQPYDIVALIPLIEMAGGSVSTWEGERAEKGGRILAAATPALREAAMEALRLVE